MKAVVLTKTGSISHLKYTDFHFNHNKDEVKLKVLYCGLNHLDILIIEGKRPTRNEFPLILGSEIIGKNEKNGKIYAVYPWTFCNNCNQCKNGMENICDYGGTFGRTRDGGFAEYVSVPFENLVEIPKEIEPKLVCASTLSSITAMHMIERARIPDKATVLVNGSTGGVGTAVIQLLKHKKCKIIARTSHKEKVSGLNEIGADKVLVNDLPRSVPFVVDAMGGNVWTKSLEILEKNGTIVFCATTLDGEGKVNIAQTFNKQLNILGSYGGTIGNLKEIIKLLEKRILKPVIDSEFPLEKVPNALQKLSEQNAFGKILIKVQ